MGKAAEFIQAVDNFVAAHKTLVLGSSAPQWQRARDLYGLRLKLPLEIGGEQHPGQHLIIDAYPDRKPAEFVLMLLFADHTICRLDFEPNGVHANPWGAPVGNVVKGPHWHSWELNRSVVKPISGKHFDLPVADSIVKPKSFDDMLRFYCQQRNIALGAHPITFPHPEQLFS